MDLAEIAGLRQRLWAAGYHCLPIYSFDHKDRQRAGKAPLGKNWEKRARTDPPECITLGAAVAHAANTGILADRLRIIDVDVDDVELAGQVRTLALTMLGETIVRHRDNSGRCALLYAATAGSPTKRVLSGKRGKIEVLGHGQQLVVHGIHPTGRPLYWSPVGPEDCPRDELVAVDEDQISAFLTAAAKLTEAETQKTERVKTNGQAGAHTAAGTADLDVIAALAVIPNAGSADWEHWNNVGLAVWLATAGSAHGFMAWTAWSAKHASHDHDLCLERWEHFPQSPPDRTGAGKLFAMAAEARPGWRRPSEQRSRSPQADEGLEDQLPTIEWQDECIADGAGIVLPERQWIVPEWIPTEQVTGFYGIGGINKTDFLLQLMMAASRGLPFLGLMLPRVPAYGLFCEDTSAELYRRAARIAGHYGLSLAGFPDVHFASLVGFRDTEFVTFDGPQMLIRPALVRFYKGVVNYQAKLGVLDTAPDFFGGNEISRREVSQFVRALDGISMHCGCAVVFSAHPSVRGQESGTLDSGSTGWGAKVRARLSLHDPGEDEDEDAEAERRRLRLPPKRTDKRILIRQKSNYAEQGAMLELLVRDGVFTPAALDAHRPSGAPRSAQVDEKFQELIPLAEKVINYVTHVRQAENYAPRVFARRKDSGGFSEAEFARAMRRLLEAGRVRVELFGPPSRGRVKLVIVPPESTTVGC